VQVTAAVGREIHNIEKIIYLFLLFSFEWEIEVTNNICFFENVSHLLSATAFQTKNPGCPKERKIPQQQRMNIFMVNNKYHLTPPNMSGCKSYARTDMRNENFEVYFVTRVFKYEINRWKQVV
jgi:hypothetical protein